MYLKLLVPLDTHESESSQKCDRVYSPVDAGQPSLVYLRLPPVKATHWCYTVKLEQPYGASYGLC